MDESEDNLSSEDIKSTDTSLTIKTKSKKRSLIERELETSLTARITSPLTNGDGTNTSRYGRTRSRKSNMEQSDIRKVTSDVKSPLPEKSPVKTHTQSPVYKMHASNSPIKVISPTKGEKFLDNQIESIYQENIMLSRFSNEEDNSVTPSAVKKYPKVYIRKDLIQKREPEDTVMVIQNMFSPVKSVKKSSNTHLNNILERSCERYSLNNKQNGYMVDNSSVVKTLDFDGKKKKKEREDSKTVPSKNEIFEMEAKCPYQIGDLAWARMGTYPFWPSIVTRDPSSGTFVKKKLFGRIERDVIHVTFFGDNGRRSWIVDNMLRKYLGLLEFESTRNKFSPEDKKKDPRLYAAYFVSEKKQALWNTSVEEAEILLKEPKRLRIDIFNDMLIKSRSCKVKQPKSKGSRANSDVSLSESLYDSLFSEEDGKTEIGGNDRSRIRSRNKSLDMFEVVTACLDNMAAKSGITKIQKQSHMDIWLQKAKSKTPEKTKAQIHIPPKKIEDLKEVKFSKKRGTPPKNAMSKGYSLRKKSQHHNYSVKTQVNNVGTDSDHTPTDLDTETLFRQETNGLGVIVKVESLAGKSNQANIKECPVNMNTTCESETFTDESEDLNNSTNSPNNKTIDNMESQMKESNSSSFSQDYSKLEKDQDKRNSETNISHDTTVVSNFKEDIHSGLDLNNTSTYVNTDKNTSIEKTHLGTNNLRHICDRHSSENDLKINVENQGSKSENNNDLRKSFHNQNLENVCDINLITPNKDDNVEFVPSIESCNNLKALDAVNMYTVNQAKFELQEKSNVALTLQDKDSRSKNVSIRPNSTDMQSQNVSADSNTVSDKNKLSISDTNRDKEDIISRTLSKEFNIVITPEHNLSKTISKTEEKEVDEISTDDDSDSERLPYSPLSNLGNNSDDNLSLDDVPIVDDKVTESENQVINTVKEVINEDTNFIDNKDTNFIDNEDTNFIDNEDTNFIDNEDTNFIDNEDTNFINKEIINKNLNDDLKIKNHGFLDTVKDISMDIGNNMNENDHISIENDNHSKEESIDNKLKETMKFNQVDVKNFDKEAPVIKENAKVSIENITTNGYQGKNVKEIDMASKEVSIYVSNNISVAPHKNDFNEINGDCNVTTKSIHYDYVSNKTDNKHVLPSKQSKTQEDPLDNPNFVKYVELRQDALLDENPELNEKEIVAYLHKTWLYEESVKSDVKKNDDLRESNLVRGLNLFQAEPPARKKKLSLKKNNSPKTNNSGNLKMFLRRKKGIEKKQDSNELYLASEKGVRKSIIMDDEDDLPVSKEEWHILPIKELENPGDSATDSTKIDGINETENLHNHVKESIFKETTNCKSSNNISAKITNNTITEQVVLTNLNVIQTSTEQEQNKLKDNLDSDSVDLETSESRVIKCKLRSKAKQENNIQEGTFNKRIKDDDVDTISTNSADSDVSTSKNKKKLGNKKKDNTMEDPAFIKYLELRQDALVDENPNLTQDEIVAYLYQTWMYEENMKSDIKKNDEIDQLTMVKGLKDAEQQPQKVRRKIPKTERDVVEDESPTKDKPKRKSVKPFYNEEYSDIDEELEVYEIFKPRYKEIPKCDTESVPENKQFSDEIEVYDEVELYFAELTKPKPNIFKGLIREKVCEICEKVGNLVKCKGCNGMFHVDCVKKQTQVVEVSVLHRGRKKKKKQGRKPKNPEEFGNEQDLSEDNNASIEELIETESRTVDADVLEAQLTAKMNEILNSVENIEYDSYSSDECIDWHETVPGKCEIIDVKLKPRLSIPEADDCDFKCNNCEEYNIPICFVCKSAVSNKDSIKRQKCHVAHCHKYYHLECLEHWPQTQFYGGEPSKNNKKSVDHFEAFTCPRHVCHTCVSDDPRGCKTRFSGDKLARCVRCPATYHSFTKCLPAGSTILTASHIICPRHYEHRAGKAPCHVNTGWCFICALGGSLICCEYCPTSFHAECLNINPPEGGYMCEDCETGRLPLYGEMVWVKLGHYRWWPGIILHPYEIPENILAVKHSPGEFVVRFFGQYDHYWVNRGRVFPFQEGDSGRISSQKSKIDAAFTTAVEHAQRACEILKAAQPNEEESLDIASSLLPPHYVKLKVNKPCGSLCGRKLEDPESSLTQCECNPHEEDPCGPYSQCLNRMLLTECGPTCRAGDRCNNRSFEKRLYPKLVPYRTPSRGWGLKTLEDIKAGQFVIEYVGELIDEEEFRRRMRRKHEIRDENFYFLTLDKERMIDAGPKGNLARFMNHCCEPNCETQKWTVLGDVRVGLFALYDIPAHSEVTFNYNLECAGIDKKRCMCGAKRCSGYIGAKPKQEESHPKKNKMHPGKRTYKKRKPEESPSSKSKAKRPIGRPRKPRELTEIEKDLLIIRNATNTMSSDESNPRLSSDQDKNPKTLKRKRVSFSSEDVLFDGTESPNTKTSKVEDKLEGD